MQVPSVSQDNPTYNKFRSYLISGLASVINALSLKLGCTMNISLILLFRLKNKEFKEPLRSNSQYSFFFLYFHTQYGFPKDLAKFQIISNIQVFTATINLTC